jgi:hypothetical protein
MIVFLFVCNIWGAQWYNESVECYSKEYFSGCQLLLLCVLYHVMATSVASHVNKSPWSLLLRSLDCLLYQSWMTSLQQCNVWYTERHSPRTSSTLGSQDVTYQTRAIVLARGVLKIKICMVGKERCTLWLCVRQCLPDGQILGTCAIMFCASIYNDIILLQWIFVPQYVMILFYYCGRPDLLYCRMFIM